MSVRGGLLLAVLVAVSAAAEGGYRPGPGDGFVTVTDDGSVDWGLGEVRVTGTARVRPVVKGPEDPAYDAEDPYQPRSMAAARLLARREAEEAARAKAQRLFASLRVDETRTVADFLGRPGVNAKVTRFVAERGRLVEAVFTDDVCRVTLVYSLHGPKGFLALNDGGDLSDDFLPFRTERWPDFGPQTNRRRWEALVISAPYLKVTPALAPRIWTESGRLIYDVSFVPVEAASESGFVTYAWTPFHVVRTALPNAFHCIALTTRTPTGTDIVLADEDADHFLSSPSSLEVLRNCRVVILAAPPPRPVRP